MKQSIKIDIIYYCVERDTKMEFEFSDSSDMPVRTLASTAEDKKEFLFALKRAVFRSDTVIVVGGLTGGTYLPAVLASAVGTPLEKLDYRSLGFTEPAKPLMFPKGSIPLVTDGNDIGGLLIEKGRQAIILLTENASIRHELLNSLVYPYIFDGGREEFDSEPVTQEELVLSEPAAVLQPEAEIAEEPVPEDIASSKPDEEITEEIPAENNAGEAVESEESISADETVSDSGEKTEEESVTKLPLIKELPSVSDGMFVIADDGNEEEEDNVDMFSDYPVPVDTRDDYSSMILGNPDNGDIYVENEGDEYPSGSGFIKFLGVFIGVLSIATAAALIVLYFMGLI